MWNHNVDQLRNEKWLPRILMELTHDLDFSEHFYEAVIVIKVKNVFDSKLRWRFFAFSLIDSSETALSNLFHYMVVLPLLFPAICGVRHLTFQCLFTVNLRYCLKRIFLLRFFLLFDLTTWGLRPDLLLNRGYFIYEFILHFWTHLLFFFLNWGFHLFGLIWMSES